MENKDVIAMLKEACALFHTGDRAGYAARLTEVEAAIGLLEADERRADEARHLRGEWRLVLALQFLREPGRLLELYTEAEKLLQGRSNVLDGTMPFHQGAGGVFGLVYTKPGTARRSVREFKSAVAIYKRLTGGGAGADTLCEADLAYYSGSLDEAEALAYRAAYEAGAAGQDVLLMDSAKLIAHLSKHRNDRRGWQFAIDILNNKDGKLRPHESLCLHKREIIHDELLLSLGDLSPSERGRTVPPLPDGCDYADTEFWRHLLFLCYSGQYRRFLGAAEPYLARIRELTIPLMEIYVLLFSAACHNALADRGRAKKLTAEALDIVFADGLYLVAAEGAPILNGLVEECAKGRGAGVGVVKRIREGLEEKVSRLRKSIELASFAEILTSRERDVALLAAESVKNADIAQRLNISQNTVKTHLKIIFSKLDVAQRYELREKLKR